MPPKISIKGINDGVQGGISPPKPQTRQRWWNMQKGFVSPDPQKGTMQFKTKKGSQQHTNTPMITDRVFRTLVSLKDILKELSGWEHSMGFPVTCSGLAALGVDRCLPRLRCARICFGRSCRSWCRWQSWWPQGCKSLLERMKWHMSCSGWSHSCWWSCPGKWHSPRRDLWVCLVPAELHVGWRRDKNRQSPCHTDQNEGCLGGHLPLIPEGARDGPIPVHTDHTEIEDGCGGAHDVKGHPDVTEGPRRARKPAISPPLSRAWLKTPPRDPIQPRRWRRS